MITSFKVFENNNNNNNNNNKQKEFNIACGIGDVDTVKKLIKDVDPTVDNHWALSLAANNGHLEVVKTLLEDPRVDPSDDDNYAITHAARGGYLKIVKELLKDPRVDPSDANNLAIRWATKFGHSEVVQVLIQDKRVDPSADNNWAIRHAVKRGFDDITYLLLNQPKVYNSLSEEDIKKYAKGRPLVRDMILRMNEDIKNENTTYWDKNVRLNNSIMKINEFLSSPMTFLKDLGYDIKTSLGHGQQGSVYLTKDNKAVKLIDKEMLDHPIDIKDLDKIVGKKFEYLGEIYDYKDLDEYLIIEMEYIDGGNEMLDYQMYTEYHIDFASDFSSTLSQNNFDLNKTIKELIDHYINDENADEDSFILDPENKDDFIKYYTDIFHAIEEANKYNLNIDLIDDNVLYDEKENRYKIIDYL